MARRSMARQQPVPSSATTSFSALLAWCCPQAVHARLEPLLLFFIDGASLIDADDDKWELLLAVQPNGKGTASVVSP